MKTKRNIYWVAAVVIAVGIGIWLGFFPPWGGEPTLKDEIRIGAVLPLTGDIASYGKRAQKGVQLALDEINGSDDYDFTLAVDFQDGKGEAQESVTLMRRAASVNHYPVVIGAAASSVTLAMTADANEYKKVLISPISSSTQLTLEGGPYFFRVCPSDAFQAVILAEWIYEEGHNTVSVLTVNNSWGIGLKDRFVQEFEDRGGTVLTVESCDEGDKDFRAQITKIIAAAPDAVYSPTYGVEGGLILRQLRELGYEDPVFGSDVWSAPELITSAGEAAEGVYLVRPAQYTGGEYQAFKTAFEEKFGEEPDVYAAYSYDIGMILADCFAAGNKTGEQVRSYLLGMAPYRGATGETAFDENGDCNSKSFIRQVIQSGEYVDVAGST